MHCPSFILQLEFLQPNEDYSLLQVYTAPAWPTFERRCREAQKILLLYEYREIECRALRMSMKDCCIGDVLHLPQQRVILDGPMMICY